MSQQERSPWAWPEPSALARAGPGPALGELAGTVGVSSEWGSRGSGNEVMHWSLTARCLRPW